MDEKITLTPEQQAVYDGILGSDEKLFLVIGPGGSGKTTLIKKLVQELGPRRVMLTATTNQAAELLGHGARTIYCLESRKTRCGRQDYSKV